MHLEPDINSAVYIFSPVAFLSFVATLLSAFVVSPLLFPRTIPRYRVLSRADKLLVNNQLAPIIHHTAVSVLGIYAIVSGTIDDRLYCKSALGLGLIQASLGYFFGDLIAFLWRDKRNIRDTLIVSHHIICIFSAILTLHVQGRGLFFAVSFQVSELSGVFRIIRACLKVFGFPKSSLVFRLNGLIFTLSFFLVRVIVIPWHWYELVAAMILSPHSNILSVGIRAWLFIHYFYFDVLNLYWFRLVVKSNSY